MSKIKKMKNTILAVQPLQSIWETQDPFLFCAHHLDHYPAGNEKLGVDFEELQGRMLGQDFDPRQDWRMYHGTTVPGFPYHPHRGFETITINKKGVVDHTDSLGAAGRFMAGDVQWMTAGRGVQHSEMFPLIDQEDNTLEIFQIWLNLPSTSKMVDPHFKMLWSEDIPTWTEEDTSGNKIHIQLIAGTLAGTTALDPTPDSWAADPAHAVRVMTIDLEPGSTWTLPATDAEASRNLYFYRGDTLLVDQQEIDTYHRVILSAESDVTLTAGSEKAQILILEGKAIGEPVAQRGPFVMNTDAEISETIREYQRTQFGGWPWSASEYTHPREKGRFALHADGTLEER